MNKRLRAAATGASDPASGRRAGSADAEIGRRIRQIRTEHRMTQDSLAEKLGLSCQQIQKYENGTTRISASRLVQIGRLFNVAVSDLLVDGRADGPSHIARSDAARADQPSAQEVLELVQAFCSTRNVDARARILEMAKFLAGLDAA